MGDSSNNLLTPGSFEQQQVDHYKLVMLYYGFFVVATAGIVLMIYHCLMTKWCAEDRSSRVGSGGSILVPSINTRKTLELAVNTVKYKRKGGGSEECVVCLSVFEEGEDVKELPRCNHSFHAPCIDKWLSSHFDCPVCRASVVSPEESSGDRFPDPSVLV